MQDARSGGAWGRAKPVGTTRVRESVGVKEMVGIRGIQFPGKEKWIFHAESMGEGEVTGRAQLHMFAVMQSFVANILAVEAVGGVDAEENAFGIKVNAGRGSMGCPFMM